jgi:hypothetical protein
MLSVLLAALCGGVTIQGETTVLEHRMVRLSPAGVTGEFQVVWFVFPMHNEKGELVVDIEEKGQNLRFTAPPATYEVAMAVVRSNTVEKVTTAVIIKPKVPRPTQPVRPEQPAEPQVDATAPSFPEGKFALSLKAWQWASQVDSPTRVAEALAIAQVYGSVSAIAGTARARDPDAIVKATREGNGKALSNTAIEAWSPKFFTPLKNELLALRKAGKLITAADHREAWQEIATGLSRMK